MVKPDQGTISRLLEELPELMNKRVPGLDFLDKRITVPTNLANLDRFFGSKPSRNINGIPTVRPRSASGVVGTFTRDGLIKAGQKAPFSICGRDFYIYDNAWIMGEVRIGVRARVTGVVRKNNERFATKIIVIDDNQEDSIDTDSDSNQEFDGEIQQIN